MIHRMSAFPRCWRLGSTLLLAMCVLGACNARARVHAPPDASVTVVVDGDDPLRLGPGERVVVPVRKGTRRIEITVGDETRTFEHRFRSAGIEELFPVPGQCWAKINSMPFYEYEGSPIMGSGGWPPPITTRVDDSAPLRMGTTYFGVDELPATRASGITYWLVLQLPCALLDKPVDAVHRHFNWGPRRR